MLPEGGNPTSQMKQHPAKIFDGVIISYWITGQMGGGGGVQVQPP